MTYLLKNALAEGSEEITSDAVNWLADVMISQDKSEWEETLFYYRALGFSEDEAFLAAMKEQGRKMLKDGAAGAITGAITAGGRLAGSKIGDGIQSYRNYKGAVQNGRIYHDLNNMTKGDLARSLGYMDIEQEYKTSLPVALEAESRSGSEIRSLLEANGYSLEGEFGNRSSRGAVGGEKAQYSLRKLPNGEKYVEVDTNQNIFDGLTTSEMQAVAKKEILNRFRNKVIGIDYTAYVNKGSAEHYTHPANRRMDETQKQDKMRASPELDNIIAASTFRENLPDDGRHPIATGGIDKLDTKFRVNGRMYKAEISVLVTDKGRVFYDLTKFKDIPEREIGLTQSAAKTSDDIPSNSIPTSTEKVNGSGMNLEQSIRIYGVDPQKAALVTRLANDTGAKVLFDGTLTEECEGYEKDGVIYLNPNANNIKAIFSHELTHVLERTDSYQTLRNMVLSQYGNNTALQNALDAKRKNYQAHGVELTRAEAAQELVAEFAGERLFTDISAIRRLASYDLNLAGKIGSAISRMASKATGNPEKSFLRNAEHMYTQAIRENSGLSPTEARFLLESNGYSVEKTSELGEISNRERIEKIAGNDIIDTKKRGRGINVEIDTFTPCLRDVKTGEIVDTEYSIIDPAERKGLKRKGWMFNWNSRDLDNSQIYKLTTRGSTELQGLVAIEDNPRSHAFHLSLVESAAQNRNNGTPKKYEGAGGHLFAIAAKKSFEAGYGGFVYFEAANMSLVKHYQKEFGAILVGMPHEYSMILNEEAAQKLLNIYTFRE